MAPFQGITNRVFRKVYTRHFQGIDKLFTPFFTSIHKKNISSSRSKELISVTENGIPVVPQILSKDADEMLRFANFCKELGFDEINWNLGCPYPRVANKMRGSGMLPHPKIVDEILQQFMPKTPVKLSVKMRLGFKEPEEIFQLIPILNKYNITEVTVHARIGKQLYKGSVNHNIFKKVIQQSTIPTGYNGDIFTKNDFINLTNSISGISFLMLGRGLLVDPFLPAHIKNIEIPNLEGQKEIIRKFIDDLYYERRKQHHDGLQTLGNMKEYWWYLSCSFDNPHKVFSLIKKKKNFEEYEDAVNRIFNDYNWLGQKADLFRKEQTKE